MAKATEKKQDHLRRNVLITGIVASLLIMVANSAIWANRYLFNTDNFTQTAVTTLSSESSRQAIAGEIVDVALKDYPKIKALVENTATNFIAGLLDADRTEQVTTKVVSRLQIFLTSPKKDPVVINLTSAKSDINRLIEFSGREGETKIDVNKIPDEIVLFNPENFPNFYQYGVVLTWLSPMAVIGAVALLGWPYVSHRRRFRELLIIQGLCIVASGVLALLVGPLFKPIALGNIQSANLRVLVGNIYDAFIATFNAQSMIVILLGVAAIVSVGVVYAVQHYQKTRTTRKA